MLGYDILSHNIMSSIDPRYFWSWCRCKKKISKSNVDCPRTECGKPLPERPKLCNPQCGSKCPQIRACDKEIMKEKLSNCKKPEKIKAKSFWEIIFGWKTEDPPNPCICRRLHHEKQIIRQQDPRLCDSRYEATPGDVFIFTEFPRTTNHKSQELQPKPPPAYKLPNAVLTKNIIDHQAEMTSIPCSDGLKFIATCKTPKCSGPKPYNLPYEELRPPRKQRKTFSCKFGIGPEDVAPTIRKGSATCLESKSAVSYDHKNYREKSAESVIGCTSLDAKSDKLSPRSSRRYSRIEQLKRQIDVKQGNDYSEILGSGLEKVSKSQSPLWPSCKMSTFMQGPNCGSGDYSKTK